ncbi:hypothetical protein M8A51_23555 [Schlegelella sp. S2-27]|uniref:Ubiquitin-activating enzyme E1 FCCH domain-containing protein n=1 Tax=Caldimonas mangrovi TaxID=2944811 RepID=A0ABT0YW32_9BURK|nr:hypothetical protein [Caldimonas mangrovi]MCM5682517.1 hypothetical protein [Caldimonas mangrovi]
MASIAQRSFAAGEIAPAVYGRADVSKYQNGLRTCRNFYVMRHGGVTNRPGTRFICEVKDSTKRVRLLKFVFNSEQSYVLEFGEGYIRFIQNAAQLEVSGVANWSNVTAYTVADLVTQGGVFYYCIQAHTNQVPPNATYWYPLTGTIYEIPSPYQEEDLEGLQFVQSADVMTIVHPNHSPRDLRRQGALEWTLVAKTFVPGIDAPVNLNATTGAGSVNVSYKVTAVAEETYEESLPSGELVVLGGDYPIQLDWDAVSGAVEYNIYRDNDDGVFGFIGISPTNAFTDDNIARDTSQTPPVARNPFSGTGNYPSAVNYYQQRLTFGNSDNRPETVWMSKSGAYNNFSISSPLQEDDSVTFTLAGRQVNEIRHILDIGSMVILTSGGEWVVRGDGDGVVSPIAINARQQGYSGSAEVAPVLIGNSALFVQARGSIVRDLRFELESDAYVGKDLTVFSAHMFDGYQITRWDFQQVPHSIVWAVRDDGTLLGLTYMRDQDVWGWHRHDTDGAFEDVVCIPESNDDAVYTVVNRTIGGVTQRYIERFADRRIVDLPTDAWFVDSGLSYDGLNAGATTITLSGGTDWVYTETLTATASATLFAPTDVGNEIVFDLGGENLRCEITAYSTNQIVSVRPNRTVPVAFRGAATADWAMAVDTVAGLDHLEGKSVGILADGYVVANGVDAPLFTVASGSVTLPRPYAQIIVGLPIESDFETLDLDPLGDSLLRDKRKLIRSVTLVVESSRGIFAGPDEDNLREYKQRTDDEGYDSPTEPVTGNIEINMSGTWNDNGRVFVRQRDPLPLTILSAIPEGQIGG